MSFLVTKKVWDSYPGSGSELLMMLALATWSNDNGGRLFPSILTLAKRCRLSESMARRVLRKLEHKGYVSVVGNHRGGKPGMSRHYQLNLDLIERDVAAGLPHITAKPKVPGKGESCDDNPHMSITPCIDAQDPWHGCTETPGMDASLYVNKQSSRRRQNIGVLSEPDQAHSALASHPSLSKGISNKSVASVEDIAARSDTRSNLSECGLAVANEARKTTKAKAIRSAAGVDLGLLTVPDWLPIQYLEDFIEDRKMRNKSMTQRMVGELIKTLGELKANGHDPLACMATSILCGWSGVYPPRPDLAFNTPKKFDPQEYVNGRKGSQRHAGSINAFDEAFEEMAMEMDMRWVP